MNRGSLKSAFVRLPLLASIAVMAWFCWSGRPAGVDSPQAGRSGVRLRFIHMVGKETLEFDTIRYVNPAGNRYSVSTLKYFISGICLYSASGDSFPVNQAFYIDATDARRCSPALPAAIPAGRYTRISFIFGLDREMNKSGKFRNPPENRMEWPETMGGGYHYMKLEGAIEAGREFNNFQAHTGELNGVPHFIRVSLPVAGLVVDDHEVTVEILMDISEWWIHPHTIDLNDITAIMDNPMVQQKLMENGADVFSAGTAR